MKLNIISVETNCAKMYCMTGILIFLSIVASESINCGCEREEI